MDRISEGRFRVILYRAFPTLRRGSTSHSTSSYSLDVPGSLRPKPPKIEANFCSARFHCSRLKTPKSRSRLPRSSPPYPTKQPTASTFKMTPPTLPQELIDKIIDQFGETGRPNNNRSSNKRVLASLSMVAKSWRERSQKHLFSVIDFREPPSTDTTEADLKEFGPVFSLIRDLEIDACWEIICQFDPVAIASLRCFRNLESLSLTGWHFIWLNPEQLSTCFSHFGETLTHLKLDGTASSRTLIHLTSMLPRLHVLEISIAAVHNEIGTIAEEELPATGSFQGCLYLWGLSKEHNDFLTFISSTSPKFETISVDNCETGDGVGKLLNSSATSLESLELHVDGGGFLNP